MGSKQSLVQKTDQKDKKDQLNNKKDVVVKHPNPNPIQVAGGHHQNHHQMAMIEEK